MRDKGTTDLIEGGIGEQIGDGGLTTHGGTTVIANGSNSWG